MNLNQLLKKIKKYVFENRHLILASTLSSIAIITVIVVLSFLKEDRNRTIASDGELHSFTTTHDSNHLEMNTDNPSSTDTSETGTGTFSDINFTLPEDITEEPQTTLPESSYKYLIKVNRLLNCVTVYTKDSNGKYTIPYKAMACSTGKNIKDTPLGTFNTSSKYTWRLMVDGTHSQYATRIYGGILFHSVPCYSPKKDQLEFEEFNKLGSPASLGCIRLTVADAKWIYDNCPAGTTVIIYDDANSPGPLGKPSVISIPADSPNKGWDPTDPDPANPWNICAPNITASDITVNAGTSVNLFSTVKATDTCGNDISSSVSISGYYDINTPGTYPITLSVTDLLGRSTSKTINVKVLDGSNHNSNNNSSTNNTTNDNSTANNDLNTSKPNTGNDSTGSTSTSPTKPSTSEQNTGTSGNITTTESESSAEETTSPY